MKRLIDDMSAEEIERYYMITIGGLSECLKELCAPIPDWYEQLDPNDVKTWVLCYVSYDNPYECDEVVWIGKYKECEVYRFGIAGSWKKQFFRYATPVDLSLRYKEQECRV
jgi:hypothetical protein